MAEGAVHGVKLHAIFQVLVGGWHRIRNAGSVPFHGSVYGTHGKAFLDVWRRHVGIRRKKSKHGEAEPAQNQNEKGNNYAENEFSHGSPGSPIVPDETANKLVDRVLVLGQLETETLPFCDLGSIRLQSAGFADHIAHLWQVVFFLRRGERDGGVQSSDADDGAVEIIESLFVDDGGDFARQASGAGMLVEDDDLVR